MEHEYTTATYSSEKKFGHLLIELGLNFTKSYNRFTIDYEDYDPNMAESCDEKDLVESEILKLGLAVSF